MKRRLVNVIFLVIALACIYFFGIRQSFRYDRIGEKYLLDLNLQLSGIVRSICRSSQHDFGILAVDIRATNIQSFDERNTADYYYCVISNGKAELIQPIEIIETGDSITVNTYEKKIWVYRKGKFLFSDPILFTLDKTVYKELKECHKL
jgi:hypothetical protein